MRNVIFFCAWLILLGGLVAAQEAVKPWTEWSKKDAEKMLNDSPWGQSQTERGAEPVDTTIVTSTQSGRSAPDKKGESGETTGPKTLSYRARFLTARPIREAFARMVLLSLPNPSEEFAGQMRGFVDRDFGDFLVISLNVDGSDGKATAAALQGLAKLTSELAKGKTYLERKDGKRATFIDYKAPIADNLGAKFVFSRTLEGQPFLTEANESVRFFAEISEKSKLNLKFKLSSMMYGGKLEY